MHNILTLAVYSVLTMVFALWTYYFVPAILGWRLGKPLERMVGGKSVSFQILAVSTHWIDQHTVSKHRIG